MSSGSGTWDHRRWTVPYRLAPQAAADLDEINHFIVVRMGNPMGAQVVADYLFAAFDAIGRDPENCGGKARPDITSKPVKFLVVRKYVVIFDGRVEPVRILAVAGIRQDLARLLSHDARYSS
jgi:plasmid stabilization system protein ParE